MCNRKDYIDPFLHRYSKDINRNIKEGISKKINVFIGDTSKSLAKKLALEYNLDIETQKNLENIIHNQMIKPLSKIDEENFSGSEKN